MPEALLLRLLHALAALVEQKKTRRRTAVGRTERPGDCRPG